MSIKTHRKTVIAILLIIMACILFTWYGIMQHEDDYGQPVDSVYDEMLEREHVHPYFPKSPKTRQHDQLD